MVFLGLLSLAYMNFITGRVRSVDRRFAYINLISSTILLILAPATNAYNLALQTLHSISSLPSSSSAHTYTSSPNTFLSTLFPNTQGPIASTIRIIYKLQSSFSRILGFGLGGFTGGEGKKEEIRGKALKVLDLLEYAAELGHLDALFKLGQLSLVRLSVRSCFSRVHLTLRPRCEI
jgi:hypothetical protein